MSEGHKITECTLYVITFYFTFICLLAYIGAKPHINYIHVINAHSSWHIVHKTLKGQCGPLKTKCQRHF